MAVALQSTHQRATGISRNLLDDIRRNRNVEVVAALKLVTDELGKLDVGADVAMSVNPVVLTGEHLLNLEAHDPVGALDDGAVFHGLDVHILPLAGKDVLDGGGGNAIELIVGGVLLLLLPLFVVCELDDRDLDLANSWSLREVASFTIMPFFLPGWPLPSRRYLKYITHASVTLPGREALPRHARRATSGAWT